MISYLQARSQTCKNRWIAGYRREAACVRRLLEYLTVILVALRVPNLKDSMWILR